jgi:hypothetical protein
VIDPSTPLGSAALEYSLRRILTDPQIVFRTSSSVVEPSVADFSKSQATLSSDRV